MGAPGGFDLAGLLNNPGFMSMVSVVAGERCCEAQGVSALVFGFYLPHVIFDVVRPGSHHQPIDLNDCPLCSARGQHRSAVFLIAPL